MARSKRFARCSCKSLTFPQKEPKKLPKVITTPEEIDILEEYSTINHVPVHRVKEYIEAVMSQI